MPGAAGSHGKGVRLSCEPGAGSRDTGRSVDSALARLPAAFREVLVLKEMHEMCYKEIAQVTDTPIGTVMSRLARARKMLLAHLKGD